MENINSIIKIDWQNQRVLTYKQVAEGLKCSVDLLRMHFKNHADEFREGVHYFKVMGEDLKHLRKLLRLQINVVYSPHYSLVSKHASSLILFTHQGAARLSKLIDTPEAWALFTRLEKNYFERQAKPAAEPAPVAEPTTPVAESAPIEPMLSPLELFHELIAIADKIKDDDFRDKILCEAVTILVGKKIF